MKSIRAAAWVILLILAALQAWSARFYPTPDGVSYLDLSDAVLAGNFRELLNAYWSPMYPALIGLLRAVVTPSAYWEFAIAHLLNFGLFIASLLGYEYLLGALRRLAPTWGREGLNGRWGVIGSYVLFGSFTLMMTPLILPTPDLLVSAACFFAFGALLRLRFDIDARRAAIVLGVALAIGSLTKSFIIPWAAVCLVTAAVAIRGRSFRPALVATSIWLLAVVPWTIGLSMKTGHVTFGDTGRLTYVWYVNEVESPSRKNMPHAAATPATDSILRGIAITPDPPGTNPVWYDPARWYTGLTPTFTASRQVRVFAMLVAEYISSLAPLFLVLAFWLIAAGRQGAAEWWRRTWVVMVPVLAAIAAYSLVLVTTRYVAPFYMAMTLMVLVGASWPERLSPARTLAAIGLPMAIMLLTPEPGRPVALVNAAAGSVIFVWLARYRTMAVMVAMGVIGALSIRLVQPAADVRFVMLASAAIVIAYWALARDAGRRGEAGLHAAVTSRALLAANVTLILLVAFLKYYEGLKQPSVSPTEPNDPWFAAQQVAPVGMKAGDRVAIVGSPFDAYWARAARVRIVAVVPPPRMAHFNTLTAARRRALYDEFARAGANYVVVQQREAPEAAIDGSWTPVTYIGWVRALPIR
ncbi:MAG TPA: hypothetical protein VFO55_05495 [Gemmatimonadaceae bacterium]|nr:hypothetical protein [Gemmatimonadaceae bacterium]